ncbi:MAG: oligoendopeptidase F, partial [Chthoniobacterales bacterium]
MSATIPTRAEIPESDTWDLKHLFADTSKWEEDFRWVQETFARLKEWHGRVGESAGTLADCLEFEKAIEIKSERLYHFAGLQLAQD